MVFDSKNDVVYSFRDLMRDCWGFLEGKRGKFLFYSSFIFISQTAVFALSFFLGRIIDFFTTYKVGSSLTNFYYLIIALAVCGIIQATFRFIGKLEIQQIGAETRRNVRVKAMSKLLSFDLSWHESETSGEKIQKINKGGDNLSSVFSLFSNSGIAIITGLIVSITLFLFADWKYFLFAFVYAGVYFVGEYRFNKEKAYWQKEMDKLREKSSGQAHESAANVLTVKAMGLNKSLERSTEDYENKLFDVWSKAKEASRKKSRFSRIMDSLGYSLFILILGLQAAKGTITIGSILIFSGYFGRFRAAIDEVSGNLDQFIEVKSGVGRLMTIIGRETIDLESKDRSDISPNWQTIELKNVSFSYKEKGVIDNFNLVIRRGEKIGLVGRSGCGKSTIIKLILGLYPVIRGEILIDSVSISKIKHSSLIAITSIVLQDSEMFNQSLKDNIKISSDKGNNSLLNKSLLVSQVNELVNKLPQGLNTLIGEKGYKVSGGERQRVGLARAVYKNSSLLILDEATSHLDSKTEMLIQRGLESLGDKTMIIIAHRLSTLRNVDRIIVMDEGRIVEQGKFSSLIKGKGLFSQMYKMQQRQKS